jgi:glycogen debranching enzyme
VTELVNLADSTVVKAGNAFCLAMRDGGLPVPPDHPLGLYLLDCRHLRGYELRLGGLPARLLIDSDAAGTGAVFELTNQDVELGDGHMLPLQSLRIRVDRRMLPDTMLDRITLHSYAREPFELDFELRFDADFRPMLEVRGGVSPVTRDVRRHAEGDTLSFAATGLDGRERSTTISFPGAVATEDGWLRAPVRLDPGAETTLDVRFALAQPEPQSSVELAVGDEPEPAVPMPHAGAQAEAWLAARTRVAVDDELVDRILRRSLLDMRLLLSKHNDQRYYSAGVPWYATLFGRDSIIAASQVLAFDHTIAEETLRLHAGLLGTKVDDARDEEPGKVLHEMRGGELAATNRTPFVRYYGTVDATPLFLSLLCDHANWTGSLDLFRELRPQVLEALRWIDEYGDLDGDGLLEYRRRAPGGLENQGWKDSWDAIVDDQGNLLRAPLALVEAQGYVLAAKRRIARLFELDGEPAQAERLRADAGRVAGALEQFWLADRGFYAMALDADKRPSRALASNQGHLLWALAIPPERAAAVRAALMSGAAYSGWGTRTLSAQERAFNPVGYHTGTIWPHDNAFFALGLRKYGFDAAFLRVFDDLLDAASSFDNYRLPELFAGFARTDYEDPVPYPVACSPQAWAAGSLPSMLIAGLGLVPNGLERRLCIERPSLPSQVSRLALGGLRVADASVDLVFERVTRRPESIALTEVNVDGELDVVLHVERGRDEQPAPMLDAVRQSAGLPAQQRT